MRVDTATSSPLFRPGVVRPAAASASSAAEPPVLDLGSLARRVGLSSADLSSWLDTGGRLTLTTGVSGLRSSAHGEAIDGLPVAPDGSPDFASMTAAGWKVRGAIPPNGDPSMTIIDQFGSTTYWAAEVERPDGAAAYTRGASLNLEPGTSRRDGLAYLAHALESIGALPHSYADALARKDESWLGRTTERSRLDRTI